MRGNLKVMRHRSSIAHLEIINLKAHNCLTTRWSKIPACKITECFSTTFSKNKFYYQTVKAEHLPQHIKLVQAVRQSVRHSQINNIKLT